MATGTVLTPATLPLQGLKVNFGNIEGFEIQTDSGRGTGDPLVTQAFCNCRCRLQVNRILVTVIDPVCILLESLSPPKYA